jgi:hypothetical protein
MAPALCITRNHLLPSGINTANAGLRAARAAWVGRTARRAGGGAAAAAVRAAAVPAYARRCACCRCAWCYMTAPTAD